MREAQAAGFWFRPAGGSAHTFGRLRCRPPEHDRDDLPQAHKLAVFSTSGPEDGSATAHSIMALLRSCTCRLENDTAAGQPVAVGAPPSQVAAAERHLGKAENLTEALERLVAARGKRERAAELLALASEETREAEQRLDEAITADSDAQAQEGEARDFATSAGLGHEPWPPEAAVPTLLRPAEDYLEAATKALGDRVGPDAEAVRSRIATVRRRQDSLAEVLKEWDEQSD